MTPDEVFSSLTSRDLVRVGLDRSHPVRVGDRSLREEVNEGVVLLEKLPEHSGGYKEVVGLLPRNYQERGRH